MFLSIPFCILTAGPTVDGRNIPQQWIDDIVETYDPARYNARINEDHYSWWTKYGSVFSVSKKENELWAVLRPNSKLLSMIESGQKLHTSCEIDPDFAKSGKAYLIGLAITDNPASLGTSTISLSANSNKQYFAGNTLDDLKVEPVEPESEEKSIIKKLFELLPQMKFSEKETEEDMTKEQLEAFLQAQKDAQKTQNEKITSLTTAITSLVELSKKEPTTTESQKTEDEEDSDELKELKEKLSALEQKHSELQAKHDELITKLSNEPDGTNPERLPAGADGATEDDYL